MAYRYSRLETKDHDDSCDSDSTSHAKVDRKTSGLIGKSKQTESNSYEIDDEVFTSVHNEPIRNRVSTTGSYDLAQFRRNLRRKLKLSSNEESSRKRLTSLTNALTDSSVRSPRVPTHKRLNLRRLSNGSSNSGRTMSLSEVKDKNSEESDSSDETVKKKWSKHQWIIIIVLALFMFNSTVAYSLLSPFFPQEAARKGLSSLMTGFVFGFYEFVIFLASPFMGKLVSKISPGRMMIIGGMVSAASSFTFGFLVLLPDGTPFAVGCFVVRLFEGLGSAALIVASYSLVALEYPGEISSVNSYLEAVTGLGFMAGPPIGAFLYQMGGFKLSFIIVGFMFFTCSVICCFILPPSEPGKPQSNDYRTLLKIPGILVVCLQIIAAAMALTYLDPTMSPFLENQFKLSVGSIGGIFFLWSLFYTIGSPVVGKLGDKGYVWSMMIGGNIVTAVAYLMMGPSPIFSWMFAGGQDGGPLWLLISSLVVAGIGASGTFIPPYQALLELALVNGFEDDMDTYGLISGLTASTTSLGSFIGPILAGYIYGQVGFYWSTTVCSFLMIILTVVLAVYITVMKKRRLPYRYDWDAASSDDEKDLELFSSDENNNGEAESRLNAIA